MINGMPLIYYIRLGLYETAMINFIGETIEEVVPFETLEDVSKFKKWMVNKDG